MSGFNNSNAFTWLDGNTYSMQDSKGRFGRGSEYYSGWGELRAQKKSPHTQVLYCLCLIKHGPDTNAPSPVLVLRSINNCTNDQLQDAIKLAALRLEEGKISHRDAEDILDRCYAELQRRLEWSDRVKEKNRGQFDKMQAGQALDNRREEDSGDSHR